MTNKYRKRGQTLRRLDRIECKCDRIISELVLLRHAMSKATAFDETLEKLHASALRMRRQCRRERDILAALYAGQR